MTSRVGSAEMVSKSEIYLWAEGWANSINNDLFQHKPLERSCGAS